jgi:hypothetical protein
MKLLTSFLWLGPLLLAQPNVLHDWSCTTASASGTAYACNISPAPTSLAAVIGNFQFTADVANTGAATINFNSLGAKTMKKRVAGVATDLAANDIGAGQVVTLHYDGTYMQVLSLGGGGTTAAGVQICNGSASSSAAACTVALLPGTNVPFLFVPGATSGASLTLNVNSTGALGIIHQTGAGLQTGEIVSATGSAYWVFNDGASNYRLIDSIFTSADGCLTFSNSARTVAFNASCIASGSNLTVTNYWDFSGGKLRPPESVIGSLPSAAANTGKIYMATDGASACDSTSGSGSTRVLVVSTGSVWVAPNCGGSGGSFTAPGAGPIYSLNGHWPFFGASAGDFTTSAGTQYCLAIPFESATTLGRATIYSSGGIAAGKGVAIGIFDNSTNPLVLSQGRVVGASGANIQTVTLSQAVAADSTYNLCLSSEDNGLLPRAMFLTSTDMIMFNLGSDAKVFTCANTATGAGSSDTLVNCGARTAVTSGNFPYIQVTQ